MQSALEKVDGVDGVTVDYASKTATVTGTGLDKAALVQRWFAPILMWVLACAAQLIGWLRTIYRVQENVGAMYGSQVGEFRRWNKLSETTQKDHRIQCAVYLAALRMQIFVERAVFTARLLQRAGRREVLMGLLRAWFGAGARLPAHDADDRQAAAHSTRAADLEDDMCDCAFRTRRRMRAFITPPRYRPLRREPTPRKRGSRTSRRPRRAGGSWRRSGGLAWRWSGGGLREAGKTCVCVLARGGHVLGQRR